MTAAQFDKSSPLRPVYAVTLGASEWPNWRELKASTAFANSAAWFADYLHSAIGLSLDDIGLLFNQKGEAGAIVAEIIDFVKRKKGAHKGKPITVVIYYVGHGTINDGEYYLTVRSTAENQHRSAISVRDLREIVVKSSPGVRFFFIVDACFSARAVPGIAQSTTEKQVSQEDNRDIARTIAGGDAPTTPQSSVRATSAPELPSSGTTVLCSSARNELSFLRSDESYTHCTGACRDVLESRTSQEGEVISLFELRERIRDKIRSNGSSLPLPEIHSPGDLASIPIFPVRHPATPEARDQDPTHHEQPPQQIQNPRQAKPEPVSEARQKPARKRSWIVGLAVIVLLVIVGAAAACFFWLNCSDRSPGSKESPLFHGAHWVVIEEGTDLRETASSIDRETTPYFVKVQPVADYVDPAVDGPANNKFERVGDALKWSFRRGQASYVGLKVLILGRRRELGETVSLERLREIRMKLRFTPTSPEVPRQSLEKLAIKIELIAGNGEKFDTSLQINAGNRLGRSNWHELKLDVQALLTKVEVAQANAMLEAVQLVFPETSEFYSPPQGALYLESIWLTEE